MTLKEVIKNPLTRFVDVRSVVEFDEEHIAGATNIPSEVFVFRYNEIEGFENVPVVFYCSSGNKSNKAVIYLGNTGIKNIFDGGPFDNLKANLN